MDGVTEEPTADPASRAGVGDPTGRETVPPTAIEPEVLDPQQAQDDGSFVTQPSKLMRLASMTRAMLDEVRHAPLDEEGRKRLQAVYEHTLEELKEVLSDDLREELDAVFVPLDGVTPSESELRVAQAQLVGWLEGLFHGIQATLWSQQAAAMAQLEEIRQRKALEAAQAEAKRRPGQYL